MGIPYFSWALACFITFASVYNYSSLASNAPTPPQEYLDAHNAARAEVGVAPISWDDNLAAYAQKYANHVQATETCTTPVYSGGPYGENIEAGNDYLNGRESVDLWVGQKRNYDYQSNSCKPGTNCGTYTQVVWRNSVRLGCARVLCYDGWAFVICSYDPPGNIIGQRPY